MNEKSTDKRKKKTTASKMDAADKTPGDDSTKAGGTDTAKTAASSTVAGPEKKAVEKPARPSHGRTPSPTPDTVSVPSKEPPAERPGQDRGSGGFVSWLALVLSLGALAGTAYLVFNDWRAGTSAEQTDASLASLDGTLKATREALDTLTERLDSLAARDVATVGELQSLERRFNERLLGIESLPGRLGNLESAVSSLQGISTGARNAWLLAEAEYYMQIANAQLQLSGNPRLASLALGYADERLKQLADPALTPVRRTLSDELRAIEVMKKPDIEGMTLTLASLAGVVDSLPLRHEVDVPERGKDEIDPNLSGIDRALDSLKRTVRGVVSVRRTDEVAEPLLAPDAAYFLRTNLALQLQAARLALLRNESDIFVQSIDDAGDWLARYYDTDSAPVQSALATIAEIRDESFSISPPDISGSLRLLRQHVSVTGSTAPSTAEPD